MQPKRCIDWGDQVPAMKNFCLNCNTLSVHSFTLKVFVLIFSMLSLLLPYQHHTHTDAISAFLPRLLANEPPSHSTCYANNLQGYPHKLPYKTLTSNFHWDIPYASVPQLTVYNQIFFLVHLPLIGLFSSILPRYREF